MKTDTTSAKTRRNFLYQLIQSKAEVQKRVASKVRMEVVQHSGLMWRRTSFDLKLKFCNFANHWPMGKFSLQWLSWPSFLSHSAKVRGMNRRVQNCLALQSTVRTWQDAGHNPSNNHCWWWTLWGFTDRLGYNKSNSWQKASRHLFKTFPRCSPRLQFSP